MSKSANEIHVTIEQEIYEHGVKVARFFRRTLNEKDKLEIENKQLTTALKIAAKEISCICGWDECPAGIDKCILEDHNKCQTRDANKMRKCWQERWLNADKHISKEEVI